MSFLTLPRAAYQLCADGYMAVAGSKRAAKNFAAKLTRKQTTEENSLIKINDL